MSARNSGSFNASQAPAGPSTAPAAAQSPGRPVNTRSGPAIRTAQPLNNGRDCVIREDQTASATSLIVYPGISSCLTITGISDNGMYGAHITSFQTSTEHIDKMLKHMKGQGCSKFLVTGAIRQFKTNVSNTSPKYKTQFKISSELKRLAPNADVRVFDTSGFALETHVYVTKTEDGYNLSVRAGAEGQIRSNDEMLLRAADAQDIGEAQLIRRDHL